MAGGEGSVAGGRGPLLYGAALVVGVGAAILFGLAVGGGTSPVAASASPPTTAERSAAPSSAGSSVSPAPSPDASPLGSGAAPSSPMAPPSLTPTPQPTPKPTPKPTPRATPRPTPAPTRTPNTNPTIKSLTIPKTEDCTGGSAGTIHVSWTIANATGVTISIDGPGIYDTYPGTSGAVDLPFGCSHQQLSHTYTVTTIGGSGPAAKITRTVSAAKPTIKTFVLGHPNCQGATGSVSISVTYEIVAATGVTLYRDGETQFHFDNKKSSGGLTVSYDCTKSSQTFVLKTTGGFGTEATKQLVVKQ